MNILIFDDYEHDVNNLLYILDYSYGANVNAVTFRKPQDALDYLRSGAAVDLVFSETVTDTVNGIELAQKLRGSGYGGGIVFLSKNKDYGAESHSVHALDYLTKPIMPESIRAAIDKAKRKRKQA